MQEKMIIQEIFQFNKIKIKLLNKLIDKQILFKSFLFMGIGDWGLGIGDWGLGPIPNPQSPIPNPHPQGSF